MPHPDKAVVTGAFGYTCRYVGKRLPDWYYNDASQERDLEDFFMATCPRA